MDRLHARHCLRLGVALLAGCLAGATFVAAADVAAAEPAQKAAVFDFELIDTSFGGEIRRTNPAEQKRLRLISDLLRRQLAASGAYVVIDTAPAAAAIRAAGLLDRCDGCEAGIARSLGAELAFAGTVYKVSNLILIINLYVTNVASRKRFKVMSVHIRGNTDTSWSRGVSYIVRNRLLPR